MCRLAPISGTCKFTSLMSPRNSTYTEATLSWAPYFEVDYRVGLLKKGRTVVERQSYPLYTGSLLSSSNPR